MMQTAAHYQLKEVMAKEMMSAAEMKEAVELGEDEDVLVPLEKAPEKDEQSNSVEDGDDAEDLEEVDELEGDE